MARRKQRGDDRHQREAGRMAALLGYCSRAARDMLVRGVTDAQVAAWEAADAVPRLSPTSAVERIRELRRVRHCPGRSCAVSEAVSAEYARQLELPGGEELRRALEEGAR
jgi:hypothetical protein